METRPADEQPQGKTLGNVAVFAGPHGVQQLRCSACRITKDVSAFPPSCAKWCRGECRECRRSAWKRRPVTAKKLEAARNRFGSDKPVTPLAVARLLEEAGLAAMGADLREWTLAKRDNAQPFTAENMMWITARQPCV
jgi:hypothetical protein